MQTLLGKYAYDLKYAYGQYAYGLGGARRMPRPAGGRCPASESDSELDSESNWPEPALRSDECPRRGIKHESARSSSSRSLHLS